MDHQIIEKYLIAVERWKDARFDTLTEKDFAESVQFTGLTSNEIREIKRTCEQWTQQGKTYHQAHNYPQAVFYLEQAFKIDPFNVQICLLLSDSYKHLYLLEQQPEHLLKAIELCRRGLQVDFRQLYFAELETNLSELQRLQMQARRRGFFALFSFLGFVGSLSMLIFNLIYNLGDGLDGGSFSLAMLGLNLLWLAIMLGAGVFSLVFGVLWLVSRTAIATHKGKIQKLNFQHSPTQRGIADKIWEVVVDFGKFLKG